MTPEQKVFNRKWIAALRSGEVKQAHSTLMRVNNGQPGFCCLGVMVAISAFEGLYKSGLKCNGDSILVNLEEDGYFATCAHPSWSQFTRITGLSEDDGDELATLNDDGASFDRIADRIESMMA